MICGFVLAFVKLLWVSVVVGIVIMILSWICYGVAVNFLLGLYGDECEWQWRAEGGGSPWPWWIVGWVAIGLWWFVEDVGDRRGLTVDCQKKKNNNNNKMIIKNIKSTTLRKYLPNKLFILKTIIILFFITISQNTTIQVLENTKQKTVTKHILRF